MTAFFDGDTVVDGVAFVFDADIVFVGDTERVIVDVGDWASVTAACSAATRASSRSDARLLRAEEKSI